MNLELEGLTLDKESHEVSVYIYGYIAKKLTPRVAYCYASMIVGEDDNQEYFKILSKGGLTTVLPLNNYVSSCFAIFDEAHIQQSNEMGFLQEPRQNVSYNMRYFPLSLLAIHTRNIVCCCK